MVTEKANFADSNMGYSKYLGLYSEYGGPGEIFIKKDSDTVYVEGGTTIYPTPGSLGDYTVRIKGVLKFLTNNTAIYTDPKDIGCKISFKFVDRGGGDILFDPLLTIDGASENCDVLLSSLDGNYFYQTDQVTNNNSLILPQASKPSYCNWDWYTGPKTGVSVWRMICKSDVFDQYPTIPLEENPKTKTFSYAGSKNDTLNYDEDYISVYTKDIKLSPEEILKKEWLPKLTESQKKKCFVKEMVGSNLKIPAHKKRYVITMTEADWQKWDDGSDPTAPCGDFGASPDPDGYRYFEFNDYPSTRYILVNLGPLDHFFDPDTIKL
jgi:hypothetical protein